LYPFFLKMLDGFMARIGVGNANVGFGFVGVDRFAFRVGRFVNELVKPITAWRLNNLQSNIAVAFYCSNHNSFVAPVSSISAMNAAPDVSLIDFDNSPKKVEIGRAHV